MSPAFDETLLSRIEDAGLNASAPPQQRWLDGWLVRFSPGKAKRARCVNAVAAGRLPVDRKLALCAPIYEQAGLPLYVRLTPFSVPRDLDARLAELGMQQQDDTRVMVRTSIKPFPEPAPVALRLERLPHRAFAETVGRFRGSSLAEREAHAQRLAESPVPFSAFALIDPDGKAAACGQMALEGEIAGLYDVFTEAPRRGRGLATHLCSRLLQEARTLGAKTAYLQVEASNAAARRVYRQLGFEDAYAYHYRTPAA